jgi:hypothetical protein
MSEAAPTQGELLARSLERSAAEIRRLTPYIGSDLCLPLIVAVHDIEQALTAAEGKRVAALSPPTSNRSVE